MRIQTWCLVALIAKSEHFDLYEVLPLAGHAGAASGQIFETHASCLRRSSFGLHGLQVRKTIIEAFGHGLASVNAL